jgi:hypothetical protein
MRWLRIRLSAGCSRKGAFPQPEGVLGFTWLPEGGSAGRFDHRYASNIHATNLLLVGMQGEAFYMTEFI